MKHQSGTKHGELTDTIAVSTDHNSEKDMGSSMRGFSESDLESGYKIEDGLRFVGIKDLGDLDDMDADDLEALESLTQ